MASMQAFRQAQDQEQDIMTATQSLTAVKTLVRAGFGCINYLRGLLPDENFTDARLSSSSATPSSISCDSNSSGTSEINRNQSGVRVKVVKSGYSPEGDKLLEFLERGIFDALEKQYLKSFVFGIYLDKDNDTNLVEAYTFNFAYRTLPGTRTTVPVLSVETINQAMGSMSVSHKSDSVASAALDGRAPTLGEVKKSVKHLIRRLITVTQGLDQIPRRRYARFKCYYLDHTPADYEPPMFIAGDSIRDKFIFTTHSVTEAPEKFSVGCVETPYHAVSLDVASVVSVIPSVEDNTERFSGLATNSALSNAAHNALAQAKERESELQLNDAENRKIVWDADSKANPAARTASSMTTGSGMDAEGEPDPEITSTIVWPPANMKGETALDEDKPFGILNEEGRIESMDVDMWQDPNVSKPPVDDMPFASPALGPSTQLETDPFSGSIASPPAFPPPSQMPKHPVDIESSIESESEPPAVSKYFDHDPPAPQTRTRSDTIMMEVDESSAREEEVGMSAISHGLDTQMVQRAALRRKDHTHTPITAANDHTQSQTQDPDQDSIASFSNSSKAYITPLTSAPPRSPILHATPTKTTPEMHSDSNREEMFDHVDSPLSTPPTSSTATPMPPSTVNPQLTMLNTHSTTVNTHMKATKPNLAERRTTRAVAHAEAEASQTQTQSFVPETAMMDETQTYNHHKNTECCCGSHSQEVDWIHCPSCDRWYHTWCTGYHSNDDPRLADLKVYKCFSCELVDDPASTLLTEAQIWDLNSRYGDLALFRRALKVVEPREGEQVPSTASSMKKRLGVDAASAAQLWKRLEAEGFTEPERLVEDLDLVGTSAAKGKRRAARKPVKSNKRVPVRTRLVLQAKDKYFEPRGEVEIKALGLDKLKKKKTKSGKTAQPPSDGALPESRANMSLPSTTAIPALPAPSPSQADEPLSLSQGTKRKRSPIAPDHTHSVLFTKENQGAARNEDEDEDGYVTIGGRKEKRVKMSLGVEAVDLEEF